MIIPTNYNDKLDFLETELLIKFVKDRYEKYLSEELDLIRISAPLFVEEGSGLNDNLNGIERAVKFDAKGIEDDLEVVHSLAKWKRMALKNYNFQNHGIYTDMNAIRRDETVDNIHSFYVDQWDWEKVISKEERNIDTLKQTVKKIIKALKRTEDDLLKHCNKLEAFIKEDVYFITSQELADLYPALDAKERELAITKKYKTVCLMQIGDILKNGQPHDMRAPDYDDWSLNCDILIYYPILDMAIEISSMGIRVDAKSLHEQLSKTNCLNRLSLPFHKALINNELPLTMGGGIGQSRICLILMNKAHIGEVQACVWPKSMIQECLKHNIHLL